MKFYRSYPIKSSDQEVNPKDHKLYYEVSQPVNIGGEELDFVLEHSYGEVKNVIYRRKKEQPGISDLLSYHLSKFGNILLQIEDCFDEERRWLSTYSEGELLNIHHLTTDLNGNVIVSYTLNSQREVVEYNEMVRNELGEIVKEKKILPGILDDPRRGDLME